MVTKYWVQWHFKKSCGITRYSDYKVLGWIGVQVWDSPGIVITKQWGVVQGPLPANDMALSRTDQLPGDKDSIL